MIRIAARDITVKRGGRAILEGVSLEAEGGALVAVIGANGAGKSTLLSVLSGLTSPDFGRLSIDNAPIASHRPAHLARLRAYLPQNPRIEWPIATWRLVALGLTPHLPAFGDLTPAMADRVDAAVAAWDLGVQAGQAATTLSGGELTRAMLARALVGDPPMLIADEPISGLDPRHALDTLSRLSARAADGKLIIAALHDLTLTARFATHVAALKGGRLVAFGPTKAALTPDLIKAVFDVEAEVSGAGKTARIEFAV